MGIVTATFIVTNLLTPTAALAARSGGRAGGRASMPRARSSSTRIYSAPRTTYYSSPSVIMAPPVFGSPFGYGYGLNPFGGFGLGLGIGGMNSVGREIREQSQESELRRSQEELAQTKQKEFELEQRLKALEEKQSAGGETN